MHTSGGAARVDEESPGPTDAGFSSTHAAPPVAPVPRRTETDVNLKSVLMTAGVALVVVVAYERAKGKVPGLRIQP